MTATAKLTASDGATGDNFGKNVAISGDHFACDVALSGEYAVVGSYGDDGMGSAYLFRRAWVWTEYARLTASDGTAGDDFGNLVDIWGANIIAGASGDDSDRGSAYLFRRPESGWADMTETYKLTAPDRAISDFFGISVGVHDHNALVGAYYDDDHGSVRVHWEANPGNARSAQLTFLSTEAFNAPEYVIFSQAHGPDIILESDSVQDDETVCWFASNSITVPSTGGWYVVDSAATVDLVAGKQITMDPLLHARNGSNLRAHISETPCTPASLPQVTKTPEAAALPEPQASGTGETASPALYPNPADEQVTVYLDPSFNGRQVSVEMYDVMGRRALQESRTCNGTMALDIASLPPGVYVTIIRIDGDKRFTGKLVVR